jgi:hypothetical protein
MTPDRCGCQDRLTSTDDGTVSVRNLVSSSKRWIVLSVAAIALLVGGCGGTNDFDAIKKNVDDHRQWEGATVSTCEETRKGSDWHGWPAETTFYACDLRNLDERGLRTVGLPTQPPRVVRVCFAVLHNENGDIAVLGPAHDNGPCGEKRIGAG